MVLCTFVSNEKGVGDGGEWMNMNTTKQARSWTRSGKVTKGIELDREKADPEEYPSPEKESVSEESPPEEGRPSKRQNENKFIQGNDESSSTSWYNKEGLPEHRRVDREAFATLMARKPKTETTILPPMTATPRVKKVKTPKPPKVVKPKKPKKVKPPKGVSIRTQYIANLAVVCIHPIEITREGMEDFTLDGEGKLAYRGEADIENGLLDWRLWPRRIAAGPGYPERELSGPPKLTLKKWCAYCASRNLDTSGDREEMQERLRDYFRSSGGGYARGTAQYNARIASRPEEK